MNEVAPVEIRQKIMDLEAFMRCAVENVEVNEPDCPLTHYFAPGNYGREIFMPAGSLVVGKIHRHAHLNVLLEGVASVMTETGPELLEAPRVWVSQPGTKRVVFNHTDVRWLTVHPTEETDLVKIEEFVIARSYEELKQLAEVAP